MARLDLVTGPSTGPARSRPVTAPGGRRSGMLAWWAPGVVACERRAGQPAGPAAVRRPRPVLARQPAHALRPFRWSAAAGFRAPGPGRDRAGAGPPRPRRGRVHRPGAPRGVAADP